MKRLFLIAPILVLAACEAPAPATAPDASAGAAPGQVRGIYNPASQTKAQIHDVVLAQCGAFDHYVETPLPDGTISYTAHCS